MGKKAHGEFESEHPGYCGAPWASPWHLSVRPLGEILSESPRPRPGLASKGGAPGHLLRGNAKGGGRIDQQTFIDTYLGNVEENDSRKIYPAKAPRRKVKKILRILRTLAPLRLCGRHGFSDLVFVSEFQILLARFNRVAFAKLMIVRLRLRRWIYSMTECCHFSVMGSVMGSRLALQQCVIARPSPHQYSKQAMPRRWGGFRSVTLLGSQLAFAFARDHCAWSPSFSAQCSM